MYNLFPLNGSTSSAYAWCAGGVSTYTLEFCCSIIGQAAMHMLRTKYQPKQWCMPCTITHASTCKVRWSACLPVAPAVPRLGSTLCCRTYGAFCRTHATAAACHCSSSTHATAAAARSSYCRGHSELGSIVGIPGSMAAAGAAADSTRGGSASAPHSRLHNLADKRHRTTCFAGERPGLCIYHA